MKIKAENLAETAKENGADLIYLSNPCCPTGLEIATAEIIKLCSLTEAKVVVDESFCVDESVSVLSTVPETEKEIKGAIAMALSFNNAALSAEVIYESMEWQTAHAGLESIEGKVCGR